VRAEQVLGFLVNQMEETRAGLVLLPNWIEQPAVVDTPANCEVTVRQSLQTTLPDNETRLFSLTASSPQFYDLGCAVGCRGFSRQPRSAESYDECGPPCF